MGVFYLCLHTVGLGRMEVVWVCFDVLFFISKFHFLFLLIFILFVSMFVCLLICFVVLFRFHSIFCIYLLFMLCDCTLSIFL